MGNQKLGLTESVSIALGGMVGGGIFAVLGVVAQIVHSATWFAFVLAGSVAACAGYSFNKLNAECPSQGGSVTFLLHFTGKTKLAGMAGWTLLLGYIGSMAMYAYAFGSFTVGFKLIPDSIIGLPAHPVISVLVVLAFLGLNLLGAKSTGTAENVMVGIKIIILLVFGLGGLWYGYSQQNLEFGLQQIVSFSPIMAAAVSFVAFQGWQLLYYDQNRITDPVKTIQKAVYIAIAFAVLLYVIVAVTTLSLAPLDIIQEHPERALAVAAEPFVPMGFTIISLAALFSTGSAINATLFSSGHFAKGMLSNNLLPDNIGDSKAEGIPTRTLWILGVITMVFTAYGSLSAITSFASLAFIVIFGAMNYLALTKIDNSGILVAIPFAGVMGSTLFFLLMFWHLYNSEFQTFCSVLIIAIVVIVIELIYFERDVLKKTITSGD